MKSHLVLPSAIAVGFLLAAGAAGAQSAQPDQSAVSANQSALPASATLPDDSAVASGQVTLQPSPTPADQAYALKAGDPNVVSNAPIPDTPAARQAFGKPMSRAGKMTKPAGN
jgi:hypothetical protein